MNSTSPKQLAGRFMVFAGVGAFATLIQYVILIILMQTAAMRASHASGIGFIISAAFNYALNRSLTFSSTASHSGALPRFTIIALGELLWNGLMMHFLADRVGIHYLLSQVMATCIVMVWNFLGNQYWTFKDTLHGRNP